MMHQMNPVVVYSTPITRNGPELSGSVRGRWNSKYPCGTKEDRRVNQSPSQLAPRVSHAQSGSIARPSRSAASLPISAVAPRFVHKSIHNTARSKCSNRRLRAVMPELGYPDKRGARVEARSLRSSTHRPDPDAFLPAANGVQPAPHVLPEPQRARRRVS